jgi:hypothetical protein
MLSLHRDIVRFLCMHALVGAYLHLYKEIVHDEVFYKPLFWLLIAGGRTPRAACGHCG